jgi:penicillin-binding protein 2
MPPLKKIPYKNGDRIGKSGLEKTMESELRGIDGEKWLEVDALGRMKLENKRGHLNGDQAFEKPAVPGKNLTLTIDQDLQVIAAEAFGDKAGALVAINPESGEILAMISRPSYDPSAFARGIPTGLWNQLLKNENKPLRDKTIQDHYPPGSVFKLVTAITGLEEGVIDENSEFSCAGSIRMGNQVRHCHKKQGHGAMNVINAIIQSCDVFFYRVGQKLKSVDQIATWAQHLGLGKKTGVALNHEVPGLIPSEAWKLKVQKQPWQDGETLSVAIGQGPVLTTVLQLANMYASIANGGSLYRPYLIQSVTGNDSEVFKKYEAELMDQTRLKPKTYELIKKGLWGVVNSPHGTAYSQRLLGMDMAGKTGTAQVIGISADKIYNKCENMRYIDRHHGLFAAFAPVEKPRIAIAVIVEHACHGASAAAPIAKAVIKKYLQKYYPQEFSDEVLKLKNITPAQLACLKNKETLPPLTIEDEETTSPDSLTPGMLKVSPAPEQHESPEPEQDDNSNE